MTTGAEVTGVKATLATLRTTERELYWKTINRMKVEARPLAKAIDDNYPTASPTAGRRHDGFDHNGRTGWRQRKRTTTKVGGRRRRSGDWPLLRIIILDGPRQIFDMAGTGNLSSALSKAGWGAPSRAAWRGNDDVRRDVTEAIVRVVRDVSKEANRKMGRVQ